MTRRKPPPRPTSYDKKVALVLQGGGALGSDQAGVYEALAESAYLPDWMAGISIGAITAPTSWWQSSVSGRPAKWEQPASAMTSTMFGQPGFFRPHALPHWLSSRKPNSYYDTAPLKCTLERLVDFDRINHPDGLRFSVSAMNVRTGRLVYFDSAEMPIRAEHVMASGALPPAFLPVEIDAVTERQKDIRYSSRTRVSTDVFH